jgi:hypothetical protein
VPWSLKRERKRERRRKRQRLMNATHKNEAAVATNNDELTLDML